MIMEIKISKAEIFDEVEKRSALEGSVLPERFEGVWSSSDEGHFLDSFWKEGYTAVIQLLKRYIKNDTINYALNVYEKDEEMTIEAEMPERFNSLLEGSVVTDIKMMIACNVLHGWLEIKAPDAAAKYQEESKGYAEDLRVKLLYRSDPNNKAERSIVDDCSIYPRYEYLNEAKRDCIRMPEQWSDCKESHKVIERPRPHCKCEQGEPFGFDVCR
jgi:hypothetical protein